MRWKETSCRSCHERMVELNIKVVSFFIYMWSLEIILPIRVPKNFELMTGVGNSQGNSG